MTLSYNSRRSVVYGTNYMVATSQPLATQAAIKILMQGGNAADAAVAAAACLNVTEPWATGIGGDCFCLFYDKRTNKIRSLNGSGKTSKNLNFQKIKNQYPKAKSLPRDCPHSITVPGAAAGMIDTIEHFGSQKLTLEQIFEPCILLAENGFAVSSISQLEWKEYEQVLKKGSPENYNELLINGRAPKRGEIINLKTLAKTYKILAHKRKSGFYEGEIAKAIVDSIKQRGGCLDLEDLSSHKSIISDPISYKYFENEIFECPPNGSGLTTLIALAVIRELQESKRIDGIFNENHNSAEYLHVLIEALKISFSDTRWHLGDINYQKIPHTNFLQHDYISQRADLFDSKKALKNIAKGNPISPSDTVYLSVVDKEGNACSFIISNYMKFGSGVIPKGYGFVLHNRGSNFSLEEESPNCLAPSKRPYHTIIPAMCKKDDRFYMSFGVMGGFMQPQGQVQVLMNMHHYNMDPQMALDAPRFCISPNDEIIYVEDGIKEDVIEKLKELGHDVRLISGYEREVFGRGQIITETWQKHKRLLSGGSDPRGDGQACGW